MKNVGPNRIKKCIFLYIQELEAILCDIYDEDVYVDSTSDGLMYLPESWAERHEHSVLNALSEYYGVDVVSIHTDDSINCWEDLSSTGIWLVIKED